MYADSKHVSGGEGTLGNAMLDGVSGGSAVRRVLIVDDESSILMVTKEMLQVLGYTAHEANSLDEAQAAIIEAQTNSNPIDAAIIDLVLPGSHSGQAVNHLLKSLSPGLITIASSGKRNDPAILVPSDYGFNAALPKPYSLRDIDAVMKSL